MTLGPRTADSKNRTNLNSKLPGLPLFWYRSELWDPAPLLPPPAMEKETKADKVTAEENPPSTTVCTLIPLPQEPGVWHLLLQNSHETGDPATYGHHRDVGYGIKGLGVLPVRSSLALTTQEPLLLEIERGGMRLRLWMLGGRSWLLLSGLTASLSPKALPLRGGRHGGNNSHLHRGILLLLLPSCEKSQCFWPKKSKELEGRALRVACSHSRSIEEAKTASLLAKRQPVT